ncbi:MAG: hypothetical protein ACP5FQ_07575 [Thermoplasmata archaeon]
MMPKENKDLIEQIKENIDRNIDGEKFDVKLHENILSKPKKENEKIRRHVNSFQVDLAIKAKDLEEEPVVLVVIEVKGSKQITTHEVITYSSKSRKHKTVFPWLRYGMIWSSPRNRENGIPMRFLKNNENNMDFAYNFESNVSGNFNNFFENILKKQIDISRMLYGLYNGKYNNIEYLSVNIDFGSKFKKKGGKKVE